MRKRLTEVLDRSYEVERVIRWAFFRMVHEDGKTAEVMSKALKHMALMQDELNSCIKECKS